MNESANTLEILIQLRAKIDEALAARNALDEVKQAQKASGASAEDAAAATEKLNLSHRELHRLLHGLPPEFSQAGYAFTSLFFNPVFAGMVALTAVYQYARKELDDLNKALDAEGAAAAESATGGLENHRKVLDEIGTAMAKWKTELAHVGQEMDPLSQKLKDQNELYNLQIEALKKILTATGHKDLAEGLDVAKAWRQPFMLGQEYDAARSRQPELEARVETAKKEKERADTALANAETEKKNLEKSLPDLQKKADKAAAAYSALLAKPEILGADWYNSDLATQRAAAKSDSQLAQLNLDRARGRIGQLGNQDQALKDSAAAAATAFADAMAESLKNKGLITTLPREISQSGKRLFSAESGEGVQSAVEAAQAAAAGEKLTSAQENLLVTLGTVIAGHSVNLQTAEAMFIKASESQSIMLSFVQRLMTAMENMGAQFQQFGERLYALEHHK